MFDLVKTIDLIRGGLLDPQATWDKYLAENHDWKETAVLLTIPLVVISVLVSLILLWLFHGHLMSHFGFVTMLSGIVGGLLSVAVVAYLFSFFAKTFQGEHNFDRGFAAVSLSSIPSYIGSMLSAVPVIGILIWLVLAIMSLVFLYQIIPSYLKVPDDKRIGHYVVSMIASIIVTLLIISLLGGSVTQTPAPTP